MSSGWTARVAVAVLAGGLATGLAGCGAGPSTAVRTGAGPGTGALPATPSVTAPQPSLPQNSPPLPSPPQPSASAKASPAKPSPARSSPAPVPSQSPGGPGASPTPLPVAGSGVRGTVTAGPTCPVERIGSPCPPRPVQATVVALDNAGATAGHTTSAADGSFALSLPPGTFTLSAVPGGVYPRCSPAQATVAPGQVVTVDIACDTGIR